MQLWNKFQNRAVVATSANGWMHAEISQVCVDSVAEAFAFNRRLLAWNSDQCHKEDKITESLKSKKVHRVIVPRGCTKCIQAPDVSWNEPFKAACTEKYQWRNWRRNGYWKLEGSTEEGHSTVNSWCMGRATNRGYQGFFPKLCFKPLFWRFIKRCYSSFQGRPAM